MRPRIHQIILPLMKITYATRSLFIRTEASSVQEILETYTTLKLPSVVSNDIKAFDPTHAYIMQLLFHYIVVQLCNETLSETIPPSLKTKVL